MLFRSPIFATTIEKVYISKSEPKSNNATPDGQTEDEETSPAEYEKAVVIVDKKKTRGFYDLMERTQEGEKDMVTNKITVKKVVRTRHRWNGTTYIADKTK